MLQKSVNYPNDHCMKQRRLQNVLQWILKVKSVHVLGCYWRLLFHFVCVCFPVSDVGEWGLC